MTTRIITTGGTIDKRYNELTGELGFGESHIATILERSRTRGKIALESLFMKDSLDMTLSDRLRVADACTYAAEDSIVITHGTDTMVQTGLTIQERQLANKTIVLTGAMIPYSFGTQSDAQFNVGTALAFAQVLPAGVYIAMNGLSFDINDVRKNTDLGIFTKLES